jgi:hypothetical protein
MAAKSAEARKVLRELDKELADASSRQGRNLVWSAQEATILGQIAETRQPTDGASQPVRRALCFCPAGGLGGRAGATDVAVVSLIDTRRLLLLPVTVPPAVPLLSLPLMLTLL